MTVRVFVIGSLLTAVSSWTIWLLIIWYLSPLQAGALGFFLFFLSLFLATTATTALLGYSIRRLITRNVLASYAVRAALRQGAMLGLFLDALLLLQLVNLYIWWLALILVILLATTEFVFIGYDRAHRRTSRPTRG